MRQKKQKNLKRLKVKICPICKSNNITLYMGGQMGNYKCKNCGYVGFIILEKEVK